MVVGSNFIPKDTLYKYFPSISDFHSDLKQRVELDPIAGHSHDVQTRQRTRAHRIIDSVAFNPRQRASASYTFLEHAYPFQFQAFNNW